MSTTAFALRADVEDSFVGATVVYGSSAVAFDVAEALAHGNGKIVTDDPLLTTALSNLHAENGPLLKRVAAPEDAPLAQLPEGAVPATDVTADTAAVTEEDAKHALEGATAEPTAEDVAAEHEARLSEYEALTVQELKDEIAKREADGREIEVAAPGNKPELAAALEADDEKGQVS